MTENLPNNTSDRIERKIKLYGLAFALFALSPFIITNYVELVALVNSSNNEVVTDLAKNALVAVVVFCAAFLAHLDFHNVIDRNLVGKRKKVGEIIKEEVIKFAQLNNVDQTRILKLLYDCPTIMEIFYSCINLYPITRQLAFTYWERYYVSLYVFLFCIASTFGFIFIADLNELKSQFYWLLSAPLLVFLLNLISLQSLLEKMDKLPVHQLNEVFISNADLLREQIMART